MNKYHYVKTGIARITATVIIAGILAFLTLVVPEHLSELISHDHCAVCQFIQHTPLLEPEIAVDVTPFFQQEELLHISGNANSPCLQLKSALSRAPPLF